MELSVAAVRAWLTAQDVWLAFAVLIVASLLAAYAVTVFGFALARHLSSRTRTDADDVLFAELRAPVTVSVAAAGFYLAGRWLSLAPGDGDLLQAGALTVVLLAWARTATRLGDRAIERVGPDSELRDVAPIFENVLNFVVAVTTVFVVLSVWDVDVTPLLASAGIVGIAVGFAARDTIANFFGSIALYVDDTYAVGDYVELDSGEAGTVVDISVRSTRLVTRDDVVVTVPNAVLNSARIVNRSAPRPLNRVRAPVGVGYGSDLDEVEGLLLEVAAATADVVERPEPRVRFRRFGDSALEYELLAWVPSPVADARVVHDLNRGIHDAFAGAGVEIPFPQREVRVADSDAGPGRRHDATAADTRDRNRAQNPRSDS